WRCIWGTPHILTGPRPLSIILRWHGGTLYFLVAGAYLHVVRAGARFTWEGHGCMSATLCRERPLVRAWPVLALALVYPTAVAWLYFVALPRGRPVAHPSLQTTSTMVKVAQFALPVLGLGLLRPRAGWPAAPRLRDLAAAAGFGLLVAAGMLVLYYGFLRDTTVMTATALRLRRELTEFGLASAGGFAFFAAFITLLHSLLEEDYWRWFVFGVLRAATVPPAALP